MRRGAVVRVSASGEPGGSPLNTEREKRRIPRRRRSRVGLFGLDGHHGKPHLIAPSRTPTNSVMSGLTLTGTAWLRRVPGDPPSYTFRVPSGMAAAVRRPRSWGGADTMLGGPVLDDRNPVLGDAASPRLVGQFLGDGDHQSRTAQQEAFQRPQQQGDVAVAQHAGGEPRLGVLEPQHEPGAQRQVQYPRDQQRDEWHVDHDVLARAAPPHEPSQVDAVTQLTDEPAAQVVLLERAAGLTPTMEPVASASDPFGVTLAQ